MIYRMPKWLAFLVRIFPGIKGNLTNLRSVINAEYANCDGVIFPFNSDFMDRKRFLAIAAGAVEMEEIFAAKKYIKNEDIVVEFGAGLGIAAARINKFAKPRKHICFEANPKLISYLTDLFKINEMEITVRNIALGDNSKIKFYALNDYILSSFTKPEGRDDFTEVEVSTLSCQQVIDDYSPTVIFCDIEGAELNYLTASNFKSVKTIVVELHPKIYGTQGVNHFYKTMNKHGFRKVARKRDTHCFTR